jgi:type VI secretion system protein ImpA
VVDLALWLSPLDGENPSGLDLRNDDGFHELERLTEPQVKIEYDERNKPATQSGIPIDWASVLAKAEELRPRGRDLRLLVIVTRALTGEQGLPGLALGLTLIAQTLENFWDSMHPALRPNAAPREAALRRMNALADLQNKQSGLLFDLRQQPFFAVPAIGPIRGGELEQGALDERTMLLEAASGLNASEKAELSAAHAQLVARVRSGCIAYAEKSPAEMAKLVESTQAALSALHAIDDAVNRRLESSGSAVPELRKFLERVFATLSKVPSTSKAANGADEQFEPPANAPEFLSRNGAAQAAANSNAGAISMLPDLIASRDDVVKCLDLVVAFYDRTEPSSPIPHLARRIRRMVHMDFVELMEDLAPSGLKEFRLLAGVPDAKKPAQKDER